MALTLWHNPRCSKSREALALLQARGVAPELRLYLKTPPTEAELRGILARVGVPAGGLVRRKEATFRDLGLADADEAALVAAMAAHPVLIERPILDDGVRAVIGRPPEAILDLL
ncbi:arsenate reductase (glutaredoxin) [Roseibacterium sp. SDUM158016]|uniref:arsenate reductase (glutaredoxin) n=1 Tax=Roseicyclus sediminis TaxID=2980997 RepID=UPI0021CF59B0|nr:arsenate reductase (glutaredoxin) [Roseibacterium sp. SDUM158016]MCU4654985.1 arsenate reductase (glutaredoxin) [Roseibacterium sp. SDUM158016]